MSDHLIDSLSSHDGKQNVQKFEPIKSKLPTNFSVIAVLVIMTHFAVLLMVQPLSYWLDSTSSLSKLFISDIFIGGGATFFVLAGIIYLLIVEAILVYGRKKFALFVWIVLIFSHTSGILRLVPCELNKTLLVQTGITCDSISFLLAIVMFLLIGFVAQKSLYQENNLAHQHNKFSKASWILSIGWLMLLTAFVFQSKNVPDLGWEPLAVTNAPSPRYATTIVYETGREKALLFGGIVIENHVTTYENDTWEWDGNDWHQIETAVSPQGRGAYGMAYDEKREVVVLFGGANQSGSLGDTWEWDGQQWAQKFPTFVPSSRCCHELIYDASRQQVIAYGGYTANFGQDYFYNDAWAWDGEEWSFIPSESAIQSSNFELEYDSENNRILNYHSSGQLWQFKDTLWTQTTTSLLGNEPPTRTSTQFEFDPNRNVFILFGGLSDTAYLDDTWFFDGEDWEQLLIARPPQSRGDHTLFYDQKLESIILFGGSDGEGQFNDMWRLKFQLPDE